MKKILITMVALIGFGISVSAQNVVIQTNKMDKSNSEEDCTFKINGICSNEDIGGVDFEKDINESGNQDYKATNYNNVTVTVLILVTYWCNRYDGGSGEKIVTKVLKPNESKWLNVPAHCRQCDLQSITRKLN